MDPVTVALLPPAARGTEHREHMLEAEAGRTPPGKPLVWPDDLARHRRPATAEELPV